MIIERVRVGDVLRLKRRAISIDPHVEYVQVGVRSFGRGIFHKEPVNGTMLGNKRVFRIQPNDLVISNVFAWEGAVAVASEEDAGTIGSHRFMTFVPSDQRIDVRWASWFFRSEPGLDLVGKASPGSAGRNRTLAIERFEALEIPLPPIDVQRRVAARLDRIVANIEAMQPAVAQASARAASIVPSFLERHFSMSGRMRVLADVATVRRGRGPQYAVGSGTLAINQACVRWLRIDLGNAREVDRTWFETCPEGSRVRAGDVLVNSTGEGTIGRAAVASPDVAGLPFDSHVLAVRCDERLDPRYLVAYLQSPSGQAQIEAAKGANTTKQTELGKGKLELFRVPVPSVAEQRSFLAHLEGVAAWVHDLGAFAALRKQILGALVPAALNEAFAELS